MLRRLLSDLARGRSRAAVPSGTPQSPEAWIARGDTLRDACALEAALECYRGCAARYPDYLPARGAIASTLSRAWRMEECIAACAEAHAAAPSNVDVFSGYLMFSHFAAKPDPQALFELHRGYGALVENGGPPLHAAHGPVDRDPARRLRVGYVSRDFCHHSVASFIEPVIEHHDRSQYEICCYYVREYTDAMTERIAGLADVWRHAHADGLDALAERIARDRVDILVDLGGHTMLNVLPALARRPAPVQATWLGYPDTTGVGAIDYRITDAIADPAPGADALHTERLLRIDAPFVCYRPPQESSAVASPDREDVVFGSFNVVMKVNEPLIALWARILGAVRGSRMLIKSTLLDCEETRARVLAGFHAHGIEPARIELRAWTASRADHLAAYKDIDIALDTYPYNGTTTTCEALWMGVPVVTLAGEVHMSRVGATLLGSIGLDELVADDEDAYVDAATALARDRARRDALRSGMRERMLGSKLLDHAGFTRRLEHALREKWTHWCAGPAS